MDQVDLPQRSPRLQPGCGAKPSGPRATFPEWPAKLRLPNERSSLLIRIDCVSILLAARLRHALPKPAASGAGKAASSGR